MYRMCLLDPTRLAAGEHSMSLVRLASFVSRPYMLPASLYWEGTCVAGIGWVAYPATDAALVGG